MLRITIPSGTESEISFSTFEQFELPQPPSGVDAEINNDLILKFEDEEEAIIYADQLENLADELDDKTTPQYLAINDIIIAIRADEFVQSYSR
jgi:hypothetical protein